MHRNNAFTLIELLVCIAIIGILISLLLPALSRTKERAYIVVCMNNQKQTYLAMSDFATHYKQRIPLGFNGSWSKQYNYVIFNEELNHFELHGALWREEKISDVNMFYCPGQRNQKLKLNHNGNNPWPHQNGTKTRSNYATRPVYSWDDFRDAEYKASDYNELPKLTEYANKAVLSDMTSRDKYILTLHGRRGLNILFGDGSVKWKSVSEGNWQVTLLAIPRFDRSFNDDMDRLWDDFDE